MRVRKFEIHGPPRYPWLRALAQGAVAVSIVSAFAGAWLTAGAGNGFEKPRDRIYITLDPVTIIGHREAPSNLPAASSPLHDEVSTRPGAGATH